MGLMRVAVNGSDERVSAWAQSRASAGPGKADPDMGRQDLRAAQKASLEAFGFRVEE